MPIFVTSSIRSASPGFLGSGDRRANAVKNYLVALEVDPSRILTISYGEERPAEAGNDESAWAKNRRAISLVSTVN